MGKNEQEKLVKEEHGKIVKDLLRQGCPPSMDVAEMQAWEIMLKSALEDMKSTVGVVSDIS